jgi:hypothetical protein
MYERIAWEYITHARHPWKVRIAALRLTRIFLYCTGAQYPLTEEMLVNELANWALQPHSESMQGDDSTRLRVYAMGMLAMALASDDAAGNLVRVCAFPSTCPHAAPRSAGGSSLHPSDMVRLLVALLRLRRRLEIRPASRRMDRDGNDDDVPCRCAMEPWRRYCAGCAP